MILNNKNLIANLFLIYCVLCSNTFVLIFLVFHMYIVSEDSISWSVAEFDMLGSSECHFKGVFCGRLMRDLVLLILLYCFVICAFVILIIIEYLWILYWFNFKRMSFEIDFIWEILWNDIAEIRVSLPH